jgi:hypothetical protein
MAFIPQYVGTANCKGTRITNSSGSAVQTIWTPGADGGRVEGINICHDEGKTNNILICYTYGGTNFILTEITISNTSIKVTIDGLAGLNFQENMQGIIIPAGSTLTAYTTATLDAGRVIDIFVMGGDF